MISQHIFRFSVRFWTEISAETERFNDTETETEMHTETEISAETDTETESFRSLEERTNTKDRKVQKVINIERKETADTF